MKKFISAVLCIAMLTLSVCSVSAAEKADDSETGISLGDLMEIYQVKGTDTIPDNYVRAYTFGTNIDTTSALVFYELSDYYNSSKPTGITIAPPATGYSSDTYLPSSNGYVLYQKVQNSSSNYVENVCFNSTGGTYEKLRINLNKFTEYFDENGCYTKKIANTIHTFNFKNEGNGFSSALAIISGGAMNFVAPDQNGMVEIYVSTEIGTETRFKTDFSYQSSTVFASGGGNSGQSIKGLTIGDVSKDNNVYINDATLIQKYLIGNETFDKLAKRSADVNRDGVCDIKDATMIQKYLAKV